MTKNLQYENGFSYENYREHSVVRNTFIGGLSLTWYPTVQKSDIFTHTNQPFFSATKCARMNLYHLLHMVVYKVPCMIGRWTTWLRRNIRTVDAAQRQNQSCPSRWRLFRINLSKIRLPARKPHSYHCFDWYPTHLLSSIFCYTALWHWTLV